MALLMAASKLLKRILGGLVLRYEARIVGLKKSWVYQRNNIAYRLVGRGSKHIILLNNDIISYLGSLRKIVEFLESRPDVAAVKG